MVERYVLEKTGSRSVKLVFIKFRTDQNYVSYESSLVGRVGYHLRTSQRFGQLKENGILIATLCHKSQLLWQNSSQKSSQHGWNSLNGT